MLYYVILCYIMLYHITLYYIIVYHIMLLIETQKRRETELRAAFHGSFDCWSTHRPLSSSFLGLPYRILNISHKKELLRGLWAEALCFGGGWNPALRTSLFPGVPHESPTAEGPQNPEFYHPSSLLLQESTYSLHCSSVPFWGYLFWDP